MLLFVSLGMLAGLENCISFSSVNANTQQVFPGYMGKSNNLSPKFACCVFLSGGDFFLQNTINQSPNAN